MAISRNDIITKTFTRSYLGYNDEEVDGFLDELIVNIEQATLMANACMEENEKLKQQINRMNEELRAAQVGRGDVIRLREENAKLEAEIAGLKSMEQRVSDNREAEFEAEGKAREILNMAQRKAQEIIVAAENKAAEILFNAQEEAKGIAKTVQEREREIMDRVQRRARIMLDNRD